MCYSKHAFFLKKKLYNNAQIFRKVTIIRFCKKSRNTVTYRTERSLWSEELKGNPGNNHLLVLCDLNQSKSCPHTTFFQMCYSFKGVGSISTHVAMPWIPFFLFHVDPNFRKFWTYCCVEHTYIAYLSSYLLNCVKFVWLCSSSEKTIAKTNF